MSLFGKILAGLKIVAAIAWLCIGGMNYGNRQKWADGVFRHDLAIAGLPVDIDDTDEQGDKIVEKLTDPLLKDVFKVGTPVKTQMDEVKRVQNELTNKIAATEDGPVLKGTAIQRLATILMQLANSAARREGLFQLSKAPNEKIAQLPKSVYDAVFDLTFKDELAKPENTDKPNFIQLRLQAQLDQVFKDLNNRTRNPENSESPVNRNLEDRRAAIAGLLIDLVPILSSPPAEGAPADPFASPEYQRVVTVVGVWALNRALAAQAADWVQIAADVQLNTEAERAQFAVVHQRMVNDLQTLAKNVADRKKFLEEQKEVVSTNKLVANKRAEDLNLMKRDLKVSQDTTAKEIANQAAMEAELFQSQRKLRDAFDKNQKLEGEIRQLEKAMSTATPDSASGRTELLQLQRRIREVADRVQKND